MIFATSVVWSFFCSTAGTSSKNNLETFVPSHLYEDKIKKLQAMIDDPTTTENEKNSARNAIKKIKERK